MIRDRKYVLRVSVERMGSLKIWHQSWPWSRALVRFRRENIHEKLQGTEVADWVLLGDVEDRRSIWIVMARTPDANLGPIWIKYFLKNEFK